MEFDLFLKLETIAAKTYIEVIKEKTEPLNKKKLEALEENNENKFKEARWEALAIRQ